MLSHLRFQEALKGLEFRVKGSGFRVQGSGFSTWKSDATANEVEIDKATGKYRLRELKAGRFESWLRSSRIGARTTTASSEPCMPAWTLRKPYSCVHWLASYIALHRCIFRAQILLSSASLLIGRHTHNASEQVVTRNPFDIYFKSFSQLKMDFGAAGRGEGFEWRTKKSYLCKIAV